MKELNCEKCRNVCYLKPLLRSQLKDKMKKLTAEHGYQCPKCKFVLSSDDYLKHAYHHNLCPNCLNVNIDKFKIHDANSVSIFKDGKNTYE
jgi:predicted RNA-binding Zn-ribbon protein involved in translation (DUF1610 family)